MRTALLISLITAALLSFAAGAAAGAAWAGTHAPAHIAATRHGGAVIVAWSSVADAQSYTVRVDAADGQRLYHVASGTDLRKWRFLLEPRYAFKARVCAATGARFNCNGPWRIVRLRGHQRRGRR